MKIKELWPFYLSGFVKSLVKIINPFETLYYLGIGLTYTQVATILIVKNLVTLIFEIPTSKIAEKYGNKFSVILGYMFSGIFVLMMPLFIDFHSIIILTGFISFFKTFYCGSNVSWIGELIRTKYSDFLERYFGYVKSINNIGAVFVGVLGTLIVEKLGVICYLWVVAGVGYMIVGLILLFGKNEKDNNRVQGKFLGGLVLLRKYYSEGIGILLSSKNEKMYLIKKKGKNFSSLFSFLVIGINELLKNKMILYLFVGTSLLYMLRYVGKLFWGPYFQEIGFEISKMGWIYSLSSILGIIVPMVIPRLKKCRCGEIYFLLIIVLLGIFILGGLYSGSVLLLIVVYLLTNIIDDFIYPLDNTLSVNMISSKSRTVILSMRNSVKSLFGIIGLLCTGLVFDNSSLMWGGIIIFLLIILIGLNYSFLMKKHNIETILYSKKINIGKL